MNDEYKRVPIKGYEGLYDVDTDGRVYSRITGTFLKGFDNGYGYKQVSLYKNGKRKVRTLHRIVAETFIPNPKNLMEINHKDENKENNKAENLEWCDRLYNVRYGTGIERHRQKVLGRPEPYEKRKRHSTWMKNYKRQTSNFIIVCLTDGHEYSTYTDAGDQYGIHRKKLSRELKSGECSINGHKFRKLQRVW